MFPEENEILRLAAAVERHSEHPLAQAIVQEAEKRKLNIPEVDQFQSVTGGGVRGIAEGKTVWVGKSDQTNQDLQAKAKKLRKPSSDSHLCGHQWTSKRSHRR